MAKKFHQINQYIQATEVRVIGADEKQIGVMSRDEAIFKARQLKMDLVMVAEKAKPPVVRIIDFSKFKYQQTQKIKESRKKDKAKDQKEIRITPFIAQGDFDTRIKRVRKFLETGHRVKLTVKFTGRQITRKEFGFELVKRAADKLTDVGTQQTEPKLQGKLLWIILAPLKTTLTQSNEKK
jgi:translation initiation factor IF-3